jgi:hypothetical protein
MKVLHNNCYITAAHDGLELRTSVLLTSVIQ